MKIRINDETQEVADGASVLDVLGQLQLNPRFVAIEVNLELVPREQHATCVLSEGDALEVVTLVGGG